MRYSAITLLGSAVATYSATEKPAPTRNLRRPIKVSKQLRARLNATKTAPVTFVPTVTEEVSVVAQPASEQPAVETSVELEQPAAPVEQPAAPVEQPAVTVDEKVFSQGLLRRYAEVANFTNSMVSLSKVCPPIPQRTLDGTIISAGVDGLTNQPILPKLEISISRIAYYAEELNLKLTTLYPTYYQSVLRTVNGWTSLLRITKKMRSPLGKLDGAQCEDILVAMEKEIPEIRKLAVERLLETYNHEVDLLSDAVAKFDDKDSLRVSLTLSKVDTTQGIAGLDENLTKLYSTVEEVKHFTYRKWFSWFRSNPLRNYCNTALTRITSISKLVRQLSA